MLIDAKHRCVIATDHAMHRPLASPPSVTQPSYLSPQERCTRLETQAIQHERVALELHKSQQALSALEARHEQLEASCMKQGMKLEARCAKLEARCAKLEARCANPEDRLEHVMGRPLRERQTGNGQADNDLSSANSPIISPISLVISPPLSPSSTLPRSRRATASMIASIYATPFATRNSCSSSSLQSLSQSAHTSLSKTSPEPSLAWESLEQSVSSVLSLKKKAAGEK